MHGGGILGTDQGNMFSEWWVRVRFRCMCVLWNLAGGMGIGSRRKLSVLLEEQVRLLTLSKGRV